MLTSSSERPSTDLKVVAVQAATVAEQAAIDAALKTADAARDARIARAADAIAAAASVAADAARTVQAVQTRADELAASIASAADLAAVTVANAIVAGGDAEAARVAERVGATVLAAAVAKARETTHTAVLVARAVAAAAAAVASTTAAAALAMEGEVNQTANAVRAVTDATAQELAVNTTERAAAATVANREATASTQRLQEANRLLTESGLHDRRVALALQQAMLTRLPDPDHLTLASRYLTAAQQDQVGGDWYDAIVLPDGTTTLVIGDVIGHDIQAAAIMGQLRNILRAQILERSQPPSDAVGRLDRANRDLRIHTVATLVMVNIEPPDTTDSPSVATLRWTNAGHPAPILIHADGSAVVLHAPSDVLLGVQPDGVRHDHSHPVPPGATLLLYTDGLIETRTHSIDDGQNRLLDAISAHHQLEPHAMLDAILTHMVGDQPGDDVAVLAARFPDTFR